jgi:hypothetical protein
MDMKDRQTIRELVEKNGLADVISEVRYNAYSIAMSESCPEMYESTKEAARLRARVQTAQEIGNWLTRILATSDCRYL